MKRHIKIDFTPKLSFEDWAASNNLDISKKETAKQPRKVKFLQWLVPSVAMVMLLIVIIPFAMPKPNVTIPNKIYSSNDIVSERITIDEVYSVPNIKLFIKDNIIEQLLTAKDIANDNSSLVLSYTIAGATIAAKDGNNAFIADIIIRTYKEYEFYGVTNFKDLPIFDMPEVDTKIYCSLKTDNLGGFAFIKFTFKNYDYFLTVREFEDVTAINEDTLKILMTDLFL